MTKAALYSSAHAKLEAPYFIHKRKKVMYNHLEAAKGIQNLVSFTTLVRLLLELPLALLSSFNHPPR